MANNSRSLRRGKQKLEPISIDELAGDSTMTGFSDLFKIPTGVEQAGSANGWKRRTEVLKRGAVSSAFEAGGSETGPPVSSNVAHRSPHEAPHFSAPIEGLESADRHETDGSETGSLETGPVVIPRPVIAHHGDNIGIDAANRSTLLETGGLETGPPVSAQSLQAIWAPLQRKLQIREAKLVQDGHTYGEQTVYEALWKNGTVVNDQVRVITVGFLRMAGIAGLAESNCKAAIAGLLDKLAIERLPDKNIAHGRTYKVYNWTSVLARRRTVGFTHVIKSRGVVFVDPKTGRHLTAAKTLPRRHGKTDGIEIARLDTDGPVSSESARLTNPSPDRSPRSVQEHSSPTTESATSLPDCGKISIRRSTTVLPPVFGGNAKDQYPTARWTK